MSAHSSRRQTMSVSSTQNANQQTKSQSRQSLAPINYQAAANRQSLGPSSAKVRRMTFAPGVSSSAAPGISSSGSVIVAPRRQSSVGVRRPTSGGRPSLSGGHAGAGAATRTTRPDPRPHSDKEFMKKNIEKLVLFLASNGYPHVISKKQLQSPSTKDFRIILEFLITKIDQNWKFNQNFEDDVKKLMTCLGYPFAISKNALQAAGSPHTWPTLLSLLVWISENISYFQKYWSDTDGNESEQRMFFDYVWPAYGAFLSGEDNFEIFDQQLKAKFDAKNKHTEEEIERLKSLCESHGKRIDEIKGNKTQLVALQELSAAMNNDIALLQTNIKQNEDYRASRALKCDKLESEIELAAAKKATLLKEQAELKALIDAQPFTPAQGQEMLIKHKTLEESIQEINKQQQQIQSQTWDVEMNISKKEQEIGRKVMELNNMLYSVSLPYVLRVSLDRPDDMLSELKQLKANIVAKQKELREEKNGLTKELAEKKVSVETKREEISARRETVENLKLREKKVNDAYRSEREVTNREVESLCEAVEDVELEIVKLKNQAGNCLEFSSNQLVAIESELSRVQSEYLAEESSARAEICAMMETLTEHKVTITEVLENIATATEQAKQKIQATNVEAIKQQLEENI